VEYSDPCTSSPCSRHHPGECDDQCCFRYKYSARKSRKEDRKPKRETSQRKIAVAEDAADVASQQELSDINDDQLKEGPVSSPVSRRKLSNGSVRKTSPGARDSNSRGRRWVRFACEKHRREHARCPDNCPMRKKSYVAEEPDDAIDDDMDVEALQEAKSLGEEEVIIDEGSTDML